MQRFFQHRYLCQTTRHEVEVTKKDELGRHNDESTPQLTSSEKETEARQLGDDVAARISDIKPDRHDSSNQPTIFLVQGGSKQNTPRHWSKKRRFTNTFFIFLLVAATGWTSAADSSTLR